MISYLIFLDNSLRQNLVLNTLHNHLKSKKSSFDLVLNGINKNNVSDILFSENNWNKVYPNSFSILKELREKEYDHIFCISANRKANLIAKLLKNENKKFAFNFFKLFVGLHKKESNSIDWSKKLIDVSTEKLSINFIKDNTVTDYVNWNLNISHGFNIYSFNFTLICWYYDSDNNLKSLKYFLEIQKTFRKKNLVFIIHGNYHLEKIKNDIKSFNSNDSLFVLDFLNLKDYHQILVLIENCRFLVSNDKDYVFLQDSIKKNKSMLIKTDNKKSTLSLDTKKNIEALFKN